MKEQFDTLQNIVKAAAGEIGLTILSSNVLSSSDTDAKQLALFVVATCDELLTKFPWRRYIGTDPWVVDANGDYKHEITEDTDIPLIDARLLKLGSRWRYLQSKGTTYNEDFRTYQLRISSFAFNKNAGRAVNLNNEIVVQ